MDHDVDDFDWGDRVEQTGGQRTLSEADIRKRVAGRLRKKTVPAAIWRRVWSPSGIAGEGDFEALVDAVSLELLRARNRRAGGKKATNSVIATVNNYLRDEERLRESVLAAELARLAARYMETRDDATGKVIRGPVVGLRATIFGAERATPARAIQVLLSPAARYLDWGFFRREKVPVLGVQAIMHRRVWGSYPGTRQPWEGIDLETTWAAKAIRDILKIPVRGGFVDLSVRADRARPLPLRFRVSRASALAEVRKLASELATAYLWDEADAAWFILSGEAPPTPCFHVAVEQSTGSDNRHVRLTLSVQPWVSAKTVNRIFRHYQQVILGRENRFPKVENLEFMDFVASRIHRGTSWRKTMDEWNRRHPRQAYKAHDAGNFKRDFQNIHQLVVWARYERDRWERDVLKVRRP